jgi:L-fuculose-phosphate aldolase
VFGHASARGPDDTIWVKAAGAGLEEVEPGHVVPMSLDCEPLGDGPPLHDEMALHAEVYRARPDVAAIVHTHAAGSIAVGLFHDRIPVLSQDGVNLAGRTGLYPHAHLVTTVEQGREVAERLGDGRALLLRGHGLLTVGEDVPEATVYAVLVERAARMYALARGMGEPEELADDDLRLLDAHFEGNRRRRIDAIWGYLSRLDASREARR